MSLDVSDFTNILEGAWRLHICRKLILDIATSAMKTDGLQLPGMFPWAAQLPACHDEATD